MNKKLKEIKRCNRCVTPLSMPSVKVDDKGVCNFCKRFDELFSNPIKKNKKQLKDLEKIFNRVKKLNRQYDCLIPLSGGKDSTYVLYLCDKIYKLKCLCYTYDNGFLSDHAKKNIQNAIKSTKADHIFYTTNYNKLLDLYKLFLKKCGNFCSVCMRGIEVSGQIAFEQFKPPLVISGGGRKVSYLSFFPEIFEGGDYSFFKNVVKGEELEDSSKILCSSPRSRQINKAKREIYKIFGLKNRMLGSYSYFMNIYDYIEADYDKIKETLIKDMGWSCPEDDFEHMDCKLHDIPTYIHTIKFPELTKTTLYHSNLIRLGLMTREKALEIEESNFKNPFYPRGLDVFLKEIGISKSEFEESVCDWKKLINYRAKTKEKIRAFYRKIARC